MDSVAPYAHPLVGLAAVLFVLRAASFALRARSRPATRRRSLDRHAHTAPTAFALVGTAWVTGILSSILLRPDLDAAASPHFAIGIAIVVLLTANAVLSKRMGEMPNGSRELHAWIGVAVVLLAAAQAATGLRITP